jgi:phosphoribosylaminoimidazolecarboxamide formyltransferase/IMP cyclohydrolase
MHRALLSVSDKRGLVEFARGLTDLGWGLISTGGTAKALAAAGLRVIPIDQVTGFPEMLDGRVKTLHPAVHAALLARRHVAEDLAALQKHGIETIDLVAVNLYPFRETVAKPGVTLAEAIENIDIGGPSMLRSAAKNHDAVTVVVDPEDYPRVLEALHAGAVPAELRRELATKVFRHTSSYDGAIAAYLAAGETFPAAMTIALERRQALRYGENPQQAAAFYVTGEPGGLAGMTQHGGKELSFNNLLDVDATLLALGPWRGRTACVIIKHTTPCGLALGSSAAEAFRRALATDPVSAFGSVIGFPCEVDAAAVEAMKDLFVEVMVAPRFTLEALEALRARKNLRVVEIPAGEDAPALDFKRVRGGFLAQERFRYDGDETGWKVATARAPTAREMDDLRFAWAAVMAVKSNAILLAKDGQAIGIGAGQMSRVDSSMLAAHKARAAGFDTKGAALASDAFFPFRDGVDEAARAGVTAIIQPGGSVRDAESIQAANEHGIAMVLTGHRQFRH